MTVMSEFLAPVPIPETTSAISQAIVDQAYESRGSPKVELVGGPILYPLVRVMVSPIEWVLDRMKTVVPSDYYDRGKC